MAISQSLKVRNALPSIQVFCEITANQPTAISSRRKNNTRLSLSTTGNPAACSARQNPPLHHESELHTLYNISTQTVSNCPSKRWLLDPGHVSIAHIHQTDLKRDGCDCRKVLLSVDVVVAKQDEGRTSSSNL